MSPKNVTSRRVAGLVGLAVAAAACGSGEPGTAATAAASKAAPQPTWNGQIPIAGSSIPRFVQEMPTLGAPGIEAVTTPGPLTVRMCEFKAKILPPGTFVKGEQPETYVWGYVTGNACPGRETVRETYLGPVIVSERNIPREITFVNELGYVAAADASPHEKEGQTKVIAYRTSTDQTLHWADPRGAGMNQCNMDGMTLDAAGMMMAPAPGSLCAANYAGPIPAVPHLHGGEVPPELDGGPEAWFTSDARFIGNGYYSSGWDGATPRNFAVYNYPNTQEAGPLWFHDHTLGATRLNVYAGLAGAYILKDRHQSLPTNLPAPESIVPVILQDRSFDSNGQLYFQAGPGWSLNPQHPYWSPEFVGDVVVVNGKAWPYFKVEPRRYRFLVLNGSNARTYELSVTNQATGKVGPALWVIGTDGGYLDAPVKLDAATAKLVIMPGERYEVIVDFARFAPGTKLLLKNTAKTPYPGGGAAHGATEGQVLQFRVECPASGCPADTSYDPASGEPLRRKLDTADQRIVRLTDPATGTVAPGVTVNRVRRLTLNEVMGMGGPAVDPVTGNESAIFPGGPVEILVNNTKWSGESPRRHLYAEGDFHRFDTSPMATFLSELPKEGDTELWEIVNLTADAHPIHLHLVQFQILNRQSFDARKYGVEYEAAFPDVSALPGVAGTTYSGCTGGIYCPGFGPPLPYGDPDGQVLGGNPDVTAYLSGPARPPSAQEIGWKDTLLVPPGMVTRFVVRWAPTDLPVSAPPELLAYPFDPSGGFDFATGTAGYGYVWHCHIIDHEDNEMMRPDAVRPSATAVRTVTDF